MREFISEPKPPEEIKKFLRSSITSWSSRVVIVSKYSVLIESVGKDQWIDVYFSLFSGVSKDSQSDKCNLVAPINSLPSILLGCNPTLPSGFIRNSQGAIYKTLLFLLCAFIFCSFVLSGFLLVTERRALDSVILTVFSFFIFDH